MKIFPFLGKKQQARIGTPVEAARGGREESVQANRQTERNGSTRSDRRNAARATELKIDAIESAMALQLDGNPRIPGAPSVVSTKNRTSASQNTVLRMDASTEILFDRRPPGGAIAQPATLPTLVVEEAAILFANDQQELAEQVLHNAILHAAPGADIEHAYLLLFDLYQLSNRQPAFDSLSNDYICRFETSPPAWRDRAQQAPSAASALLPPAASPAEHFMMPDIVTGDTRQLLDAITGFAAGRSTVVLDCSRLHRIDFSASGQLLTGLVPLADKGKIIEFHDANYLVGALLNVMGLNGIARIVPRKG